MTAGGTKSHLTHTVTSSSSHCGGGRAGRGQRSTFRPVAHSWISSFGDTVLEDLTNQKAQQKDKAEMEVASGGLVTNQILETR